MVALSSAPSGGLDVSVVLPVYNEAGHVLEEIARITAALDGSELSYEVIVVDDGSTDGSTDELAAVEGIRLIRFPVNRGTGTARRVGTQEATGRVVVWTDADMTYPNEKIPELVRALEGYDHVVGARRTEEGTHKLFRVPAKWTIRRIASYLTQTKIPDLNSGLRAFRRDVALQYIHLLPSGFSCVTTLTMTFLANGYTVKYFPIDYFPRAGRSKFHWRRDTARYLSQVVRMVLTYKPLRVFGPASAILITLGIGKLIYDWSARDFRLASNTLLLLFSGLLCLALGLLADLIVTVSKAPQPLPPAVLRRQRVNETPTEVVVAEIDEAENSSRTHSTRR